MRPPRSRDDQLDRDRRPAARRRAGRRRAAEMRCWIAVPSTTPSDRRDRQQQAGADVDVAVDAALGERAEQADEDDRGEAGAGRQPLAVAEPEDQQRHDHGAAADPEEAAEDAGEGADRGQLQGAARRRPSRDTRCRVSRTGRRGARRRALGRWRRCAPTPPAAAILTDVDGTLAPIVERPEQAAVPARGDASCSRRLSERYGLVGCVSGRRAEEARRLVGVDGIAYAATTGSSCCCPATRSRGSTPRWTGRERRRGGVRRRARRRGAGRRRACGSRTRARSRRCTGAAPRTSARAEARAHEIAAEAGRAGLEPRWGRKVLELRPAGGGGKDAAVAALLAADGVDRGRLRRRRPHRPRRLPPPARAARGGRAGGGGLRRRRSRPRGRRRSPRSPTSRSTGRRAGWRSSRRWRRSGCPTPTCCASPSSSPPPRRPRWARSPRSRPAATTTRRPWSSPRPGGWSRSAIGLYLGRPARAADGVRDALARARTATTLPPETRPGSPSAGSGRSALTALVAGVLGDLLPRRRRDRRRLRPARLARLALARGGGARRSSSATASSSTSCPTPPCGRSSWSARPGLRSDRLHAR